MRILLLASQPFFAERGTPIAVLLAAVALCRAGHAVDVLTLHEGRDVHVDGLRVLRIPRPPGVDGVPIGLSWKKLVCDAWLAACAWRRVRRGGYDVLHAVEESVFAALPLAASHRLPLVYDMDSVLSDQLLERWPRLRPLAQLFTSLERLATRHADLVLAVCPDIADRVQDGAPGANVAVVPDVAPPVDSAWWPHRPDQPLAVPDLREWASGGTPLALYVGNLERHQGVDLLLESFAALPVDLPARLAVVGGPGDRVLHYRERARALGVAGRVHFAGPRPLGELPGLLAQADVLCSPRLAGVNTPMKIYGYLAARRAILATDIRSHTQVLDASTACLAPPTVDAFCAGLARLLGDAPLRHRYAEAAGALAAAAYGFDAFERRLLAAYATLRLEQRPVTA